MVSKKYIKRALLRDVVATHYTKIQKEILRDAIDIISSELSKKVILDDVPRYARVCSMFFIAGLKTNDEARFREKQEIKFAILKHLEKLQKEIRNP